MQQRWIIFGVAAAGVAVGYFLYEFTEKLRKEIVAALQDQNIKVPVKPILLIIACIMVALCFVAERTAPKQHKPNPLISGPGQLIRDDPFLNEGSSIKTDIHAGDQYMYQPGGIKPL